VRLRLPFGDVQPFRDLPVSKPVRDQLCDIAKPLGLTINLEFVTFASLSGSAD